MKTYSIEEINTILNGELIGHTTIKIEGPEQLSRANEHHISFIGMRKFIKEWDTSKACAAIVDASLDISPSENKAFIKVKNVDLAMAKILELFAPPLPYFEHDIHPKAVIDASAKLGENCKIGAGVYIGKNVSLGKNVHVFANATILDDCQIGDNTLIWSGAIIRERCVIGTNCILHPNCTIGADGFGFRPAENGQGLVKIPQIGNVILGNYVEIGAGSCVDRGKFSSTILGDGCKIDNLVQIGHNCVLGKFCIMAGSSGLAGSVTLGDGVMIGGSASIKDHTTIGSGAIVGAGSGVLNDIPAGGKVLGYPAHESRETLKQWVALRKLARE
ncbi:MAG: UDP-3-O-(3-hydroxymyristoyl)glucosamine N-acyltransferase [Chitinophagaceae bacterium]|nr:UDP-3-O-(3-hydroxymyristoyl)glucosamine N-acyltransferase [Chitinophagaceae bacterium]